MRHTKEIVYPARTHVFKIVARTHIFKIIKASVHLGAP